MLTNLQGALVKNVFPDPGPLFFPVPAVLTPLFCDNLTEYGHLENKQHSISRNHNVT